MKIFLCAIVKTLLIFLGMGITVGALIYTTLVFGPWILLIPFAGAAFMIVFIPMYAVCEEQHRRN